MAGRPCLHPRPPLARPRPPLDAPLAPCVCTGQQSLISLKSGRNCLNGCGQEHCVAVSLSKSPVSQCPHAGTHPCRHAGNCSGRLQREADVHQRFGGVSSESSRTRPARVARGWQHSAQGLAANGNCRKQYRSRGERLCERKGTTPTHAQLAATVRVDEVACRGVPRCKQAAQSASRAHTKSAGTLAKSSWRMATLPCNRHRQSSRQCLGWGWAV